MFIGADPEFVIIKKATGESVSAHNFFPDKTAKIVVPLKKYATDGYNAKLFRDGYNLEVNVPAANCRAYLATWMQEALVAAFAKIGPEYTLAPIQAVKVDLAHMKDAPDDLKTFGCDPSYCAYDLVPKVPQIDAMTHEFRYAGGHLHFSGLDTINEPSNHPTMIRLLDVYLGLPLAALFGDEKSSMRRKYYGQAGEFRSQKYPLNPNRILPTIGVEYRTPGPEVWTQDNFVMSFAFGIGRRILSQFAQYKTQLDDAQNDDVREAINSNPEKAWGLLRAVPGFYNADFLKALKPKLTRELTLQNMERDAHCGFTEVAIADLGLKVPGVSMDVRRSVRIGATDVSRADTFNAGISAFEVQGSDGTWYNANGLHDYLSAKEG